MKIFRSKNLYIILILTVLIAGGAVFYTNRRQIPADVPPSNHQTLPDSKTLTPALTNQPPTSYKLPATLLLPVPFTSQAPRGNWVEPYKEACEEASMIMAFEYFKGNEEKNLEPGFVEQEIKKLVDWEQERFGYHLDIDTKETSEVLQFHGLKTKILENFTEEDLKTELAQGRLILLPANGQKLNNPNFRQPGPPYHMLVVKGYTSQGFVTNDPGTRKGLNYPYTFNTLYQANGNWSHDLDQVNLNEKMVIAVWK